MHFLKYAVTLFGSLSASLLLLLPAQASSLSLNFIGQSIVSTGTQYQGTEVGGLSGITYDPNLDLFYAISDDRSQTNPARFYTLELNLDQFNLGAGTGGVTFKEVTSLLQSNGQLFPPSSLDTEGIALVGNSVYISSEGQVTNNRTINPFVNQFSLANGQQIQALPIPSQFLPTRNANGVRNNLSLESLTVTPNQQYLLTASEVALVQDGANPTLTDGSPSRILQYDLTTGQPIAQYLYNIDPITFPSLIPGGTQTTGLVDLLALDNSGQKFIALERSFSLGALQTPGFTGFSAKLYEVSLTEATDISGLSSLEGVSDIVAAQKTLLLDLTTLGIPLDNLEGLTLGSKLPNGSRSLILVSDNNINSFQQTQFLAFEVVPEPLTLLGAGTALGFGVFFKGKTSQQKNNIKVSN